MNSDIEDCLDLEWAYWEASEENRISEIFGILVWGDRDKDGGLGDFQETRPTCILLFVLSTWWG